MTPNPAIHAIMRAGVRLQWAAVPSLGIPQGSGAWFDWTIHASPARQRQAAAMLRRLSPIGDTRPSRSLSAEVDHECASPRETVP